MTPAQQKTLWGMVGQLQKQGLSKDEATDAMRALVKSVSGQTSVKVLTTEQTSQVIEGLKTRLHAAELASHDMVSPEQQKMLGWLQEALGMSIRDYRGLCRRVIKVWCPQKRAEAVAMHECLESMLRRQVDAKLLVNQLKPVRLSTEDQNFVESVHRMQKQGRLAISTLVILVKIGRRYGVVSDTSQAVSDDARGVRAAERQSSDGEAAAVRRSDLGTQGSHPVDHQPGKLIELSGRAGRRATRPTSDQEHVQPDRGGKTLGILPQPDHASGAKRAVEGEGDPQLPAGNPRRA